MVYFLLLCMYFRNCHSRQLNWNQRRTCFTARYSAYMNQANVHLYMLHPSVFTVPGCVLSSTPLALKPTLILSTATWFHIPIWRPASGFGRQRRWQDQTRCSLKVLQAANSQANLAVQLVKKCYSKYERASSICEELKRSSGHQPLQLSKLPSMLIIPCNLVKMRRTPGDSTSMQLRVASEERHDLLLYFCYYVYVTVWYYIHWSYYYCVQQLFMVMHLHVNTGCACHEGVIIKGEGVDEAEYRTKPGGAAGVVQPKHKVQRVYASDRVLVMLPTSASKLLA